MADRPFINIPEKAAFKYFAGEGAEALRILLRGGFGPKDVRRIEAYWEEVKENLKGTPVPNRIPEEASINYFRGKIDKAITKLKNYKLKEEEIIGTIYFWESLKKAEKPPIKDLPPELTYMYFAGEREEVKRRLRKRYGLDDEDIRKMVDYWERLAKKGAEPAPEPVSDEDILPEEISDEDVIKEEPPEPVSDKDILPEEISDEDIIKEKPETPESKITVEEVEKDVNKIVKSIKKSEDAKKILEDDDAFQTRTEEGRKLKSIAEVIEWIEKLGGSGSEESKLAKFLEHFHPVEERPGQDIIHWIETSINDKHLADRLKAIKKQVMKIEEYEKAWIKAKGSIEEFMRNKDMQKIAEMIRQKVIEALKRRIAEGQKRRKKKIDDIDKNIDKKKKVVEDLALKGQELIQKQKEIYQIEDEITKRIDHSEELIEWILEYKKKLLTLSRNERVEGWKKIAKAVETLVDHSTQISELAAKGQEEIRVVEKDTKKAESELGDAAE